MKKPTVISVAIHKGGSSKSTTASNLGYALGKLGFKVLLIDTDSQKNLSQTYGFGKPDAAYDYKNFCTALTKMWDLNVEDGDLRKYILNTDYPNIDIIIGSLSLSIESEAMITKDRKEDIIKMMLEGIRGDKYYDFVIFDTDSTLGVLNTSVINASDEVLIPLTATSYGASGLATFIAHFNKKVKQFNSDVNILGVMLGDIDKRESLSIEIPEAIDGFLQEVFPGIKMLKTQIPKDANIDKSQGMQVPLEEAFPKSRAIEYYDKLAKEVIKIVKNR